ncbi:MBL fold metallo-hydrolase [Halovenus salina]|uniref:MBL fold metallo-hydrolase n=1 Tax=Halovenus salina TaxID=1510225 RepID=A0ABD5W143_9EURY|nr:MBL fold metallo-hydrolase [Halovenus salina]
MERQFPALDESVGSITAASFKRRLDEGEEWTLLDTRPTSAFEQWRISHPNVTAVNVPFTAFLDENGEPADSVPEGVPDEQLVTCCAKGISSRYVAEFLAREGWDVRAIDDGMEGWARLDELRHIETGPDLDAVQFHRPSSGCLAYLLVSDGEAAVIDPLRAFAGEYVEQAHKRGATLRYAIDTHVHADHVSGVRAVAAESEAEVVVPERAQDRGATFDGRFVADGDTLTLGETSIDVVGLPGHTTEMTGYRIGELLLTGDSLFLDSVARPDLEDEDAAREAATQLWETRQQFAALPDETIIGPGHVGPTTAPSSDGTYTARLGSLRQALDAFEDDREGFIERVTANLPPRPNNYEEIIALNLGQQSATDEETFELELGPNNCAVDG